MPQLLQTASQSANEMWLMPQRMSLTGWTAWGIKEAHNEGIIG